MVLEQLVSIEFLERKRLFAIFLGFVYTLIAGVTSYIFFRDNISISMFFLITLLLIPSLANIIADQERRESKEGFKKFIRNHKDVFEVYLFLSIGIVAGYGLVILLLGTMGFDINLVLSEQVKQFGSALTGEMVQEFDVNKLNHFFGIFTSNLGVAILFFVLSFFYGAGAIFLIVWNASIFSTFLVLSLQNIGKGVNHAIGLIGAFSIYFIPEVAGFLLAGIAGGVISKAVIVESWGSNKFRNVLRDASILLAISFVFLLVAGILESFVAVELIKALV